MDNLWIILLLVGVVTTFSRKSEKRKATPQKDSDQQDAQTAWERRIRELLGEEEGMTTPQSAPQSAPKEPVNSPKTASTVQSPLTDERKTINTPAKIAHQRVEQKGKPAFNHTPVTSAKANATITDKIKEGEIGSNSEIGAILDEFTMEKAVIYSEILKPKFEEI